MSQPVAPLRTDTHAFAFHGRSGDLLQMQLVNVLLTIVTFGVYHAWGRAKVRRYLFSQLEFEGQRFTYHGTGRELFIGSLKVLVILAVVFGSALLLGQSADSAAQLAGQLVAYSAFTFLYPFALVGSRRYMLSRLSWQGIRFSFRGTVGGVLKIYVPALPLCVVTLGLYTPVMQARVRRYIINHTYFGNQAFGSDLNGRPLVSKFFRAGMFQFPSLGLSWVWYSALRQSYYAAHTTFGGARFRSDVTTGRLLGLYLSNGALLLLSLGIAAPWVALRTLRFQADQVVLVGSLDLAAIRQEAMRAAATGEGLAEVIDLDMGLAI